MEIRTIAPASSVRADAATRIISGLVVPYGVYARVASGQVVAFAPGALNLSPRAKLVLDHDPGRPVAVLASSHADAEGVHASFRVPPGVAGDAVLAEAAEGLRDGLSVSADVTTATETPDGLWVTAAAGRHVALVSEPAFDDARVSAVTATAPAAQIGANPVTVTADAPATAPPPAPAEASPPPPPAPSSPAATLEAGATLTPAGAAFAGAAAPAVVSHVREPWPYAMPHALGGPSFMLDAWAAMTGERIAGADADRWRRAEAMAADESVVRAAVYQFGRIAGTQPPANVTAADGTTTTVPDLAPVRQMPERFVPLRSPKAPLWTALRKFPTPDFRTIDIPRTETEVGLSGTPADEVTPIAPGTITTSTDAIVIEEVEGAYNFSRKLLLGSNPNIDQIARDAMDRAFLADVETRATAFFLAPGNSTAAAGIYADGLAYVKVLRGRIAAIAAATVYLVTDILPATAEYEMLAAADDDQGRPLFINGPRVNAPGEAGDAYASLDLQGVPIWPGPYMTATKTLILDQSAPAACAFVVPQMNFRLEWTSDAATGGNVKVLKLVKYSGVGFWTQYLGGVIALTGSATATAARAAKD